MYTLGVFVLGAVILAGGVILMALAGILVLLATEPFYPFLPFFAPLALGIIWLAGHLTGRTVKRLFPEHPDQRAWIRNGWIVVIPALGLCAWGVYNLATTPLHWQ